MPEKAEPFTTFALPLCTASWSVVPTDLSSLDTLKELTRRWPPPKARVVSSAYEQWWVGMENRSYTTRWGAVEMVVGREDFSITFTSNLIDANTFHPLWYNISEIRATAGSYMTNTVPAGIFEPTSYVENGPAETTFTLPTSRTPPDTRIVPPIERICLGVNYTNNYLMGGAKTYVGERAVSVFGLLGVARSTVYVACFAFSGEIDEAGNLLVHYKGLELPVGAYMQLNSTGYFIKGYNSEGSPVYEGVGSGSIGLLGSPYIVSSTFGDTAMYGRASEQAILGYDSTYTANFVGIPSSGVRGFLTTPVGEFPIYGYSYPFEENSLGPAPDISGARLSVSAPFWSY